MSGDPTFFTKIGQSLLCTGGSTQIQYLHINVPNSPIYHHKRPLGPINSNHNNICKTYQLYIIVTRVNDLLLYNTYIKMKNILIHANPSKPHSGFLLNDLYDEPSPRTLLVPVK